MIRRLRLLPIFAAALLSWPAIPSSAQPSPSAAAPEADRMAKALKLAQTVQPREIVVEQALVVLDKQAVEALLADPSLRQAESENPGLVQAMWVGAKPIIGEMLLKSLPDLWKGLAGVYAKHLTSPQLDEVTRFFQSPTGQKFLSEMNRNVDIMPMMRDVARPGGDIGKSAYLESISGASRGAEAAMTEAERKEFLRFIATPAGRMLEQVGPDATQVTLGWMNREDPEMNARIEAAMTAAVESFLGLDPNSLREPEPRIPTTG